MTLEEFLRATEKKEFLEPDSWEVMKTCSKYNIQHHYQHLEQETKRHVCDLWVFFQLGSGMCVVKPLS